jgi:glycosyltransferase involved in cell wall biosynthesis
MTHDAIAVSYYGEIFSSSGYGTAARAYIHALHAAGVRVAITGAGQPPPTFADALVASLVGQEPNADFTIMHAIPHFWPRWAYSARNVIAITVWEADPIPRAWHRTLSRAVDVWVPCEFNVEAFGKALGSAPFRLPYALPPSDDLRSHGGDAFLGVSRSDFVFYSIFDWQYRKNAHGMMEAFLRAFPDGGDAVLLLKTIAPVADEAQRALEQLRAEAQSQARVLLRCASFEEAQIDALHARGDCYVSLHRGEGWGYPLFEAAARGTPTIASAQGGPLDFLDPSRHRLIACNEVAVQEPYFLFTQQMTWGEPDLLRAAEAFRWVYEHRDRARADAAAAAPALRATYSVERIGELAKSRLLDLLQAKSASA